MGSGASRNSATSSNSGSRTSTSRTSTGRGVTRVRVPVAAPQVVRVAAPAPVVQVPAPLVRVTAPAPRVVETVQAANSGSVGNLFGDGNFNVRFNTPDFNIEY